ncbi:3-hydroxyacyl-CoA dehydrogenase family protein [Flavihumibacter sp. UBA7668]|uniref:3-hydroxyacyl-CoA dehydrogenase family protein n=1 Tax=Flavihumibacter sp. UBA7668 TaxID=1946542 RepID=UPI0025B9AB81|nr:3-hydroxyacyl-CoA dehydrogenase family protein [Flavihumibacter sp. UBA7668]
MMNLPIKVAILANDRQDLFPPHCEEPVVMLWADSLDKFLDQTADLFIDLDFDGSEIRKKQLKTLQPSIIMVNSVSWTCKDLPTGFVRLNAWPGFTHPEILELAFEMDELPEPINLFAAACGKTCLKVPDTIGMIRPRMLAMILNEAWMALEEKISSRKDIDTAMKMGTNYPLGPFEWTDLIGKKQVLTLLQQLEKQNPSYKPSSLLERYINEP